MIPIASIRDAGKVYARMRRERGLKPIKETLKAVPGTHGPVQFLASGVVYTLMRGDKACPAS